jgi:acetyl-CoA acetyltransferase
MIAAVVLGVSMTPFGQAPRRSAHELACAAIEGAVRDAGVDPSSVRAAFGHQAPAVATAGLRGAKTREANGDAVDAAVRAVATGEYACVVAVGASGRAPASTSGRLAASSFVREDARAARQYFAEYGATADHLARIATKNRAHAAYNALAFRREAVGKDDDELVTSPLTRSMCAPTVDGGAAVVVVSADVARRHTRAPILAVSSVAVSADASRRAAADTYARSGVEPADVDLYEVHDVTAYAELEAYEALGLCGRGKGARLVDEGATSLGGRQPVNASGGLLSRGHAPAATAIAQIVEITWQLRGVCGARQVPRATVGVAHAMSDRDVAYVTSLRR